MVTIRPFKKTRRYPSPWTTEPNGPHQLGNDPLFAINHLSSFAQANGLGNIRKLILASTTDTVVEKYCEVVMRIEAERGATDYTGIRKVPLINFYLDVFVEDDDVVIWLDRSYSPVYCNTVSFKISRSWIPELTHKSIPYVTTHVDTVTVTVAEKFTDQQNMDLVAWLHLVADHTATNKMVSFDHPEATNHYHPMMKFVGLPDSSVTYKGKFYQREQMLINNSVMIS